MKTSLTLSEFRAANTVQREVCSFATLLAKLKAADRKMILDALADQDIQATAITKVLKARYGWNSGPQVIARHRRHGCQSCDRLT